MTDDLAVARRVLSAEAEALGLLADQLDADFSAAVETCFAASGRIICAGVGKSGHVARKIAATLASTGSPAQFVHPNEASHGDLGMITKQDVVLLLSKSGANAELSDVLHYTRRFSIPLIGITAKPEAALAKACDIVLLLPDIAEACAVTRAPTTSTTLMMALGDALAVALLERRGFKEEDFSTFHPGGKLGAMLKKVGEIMRTGDDKPVVRQGSSFDAAIDVLSEMGMGCVGIVDDQDQLLGIMTNGDIRKLVRHGKRYDTIDDAMNKSPITVTPDTLAHSAISLMSERSLTQLFVTDEAGKFEGVVHMHDMLRAGVI